MRLPWPRMLALVLTVVGAACLLTGVLPIRPRAYTTILRADRITVYEGLPHPSYEELAFQVERKNKETVQLSDYPFYRQSLAMKAEDVKALQGRLGSAGLYRSYTGEKKCGGFHPDYAVEWSTGGKVFRSLICFGCSEARIDGPGGTSMYDLRLSDRTGKELIELLRPYRQNRPPHERFGPVAGGTSGRRFDMAEYGRRSRRRGRVPIRGV